MSFTDDDLKRLKDRKELNHCQDAVILTHNQLFALLARLEAAEKYVKRFQRAVNGLGEQYNYFDGHDEDALKKLKKEWLKSKTGVFSTPPCEAFKKTSLRC